MNHYIKATEEMGRGIYASKDIKENEIVFQSELLVFNERDTVIVNQTDLRWYTFKYNEKQDCLVLGDGEIFNHDNSPNVAFRLIDFDGRKVMQFYAVKEIKQDQQLFIDYESDVKVDSNQYVNKNMF